MISEAARAASDITHETERQIHRLPRADGGFFLTFPQHLPRSPAYASALRQPPLLLRATAGHTIPPTPGQSVPEAALRAQIQALTRSLPHDGTRNGMKSERSSKRLMLRRIRLHPRPASCTLLPHGRGAGSVYGTKTRQAAGITRAACLDMNITVRYRTA